jgi:plasmid rolling circle replication initiator protein Rep
LNFTTDGVVLQDKRNGKERPWKPKKVRGLILADSYKRIGYEKKAERVKLCATVLTFSEDKSTKALTFKRSNFCRDRMCPVCQWQRSLRIFFQVSKVMDVAQERYENLVPIFLTLTVKNCLDIELEQKIRDIFKAWNVLMNHRKIERILKGWFRALEVTYDKDKVIGARRYNKRKAEYDRVGIKSGDVNPNHDTYHPHIHAILMVDKSYFHKDNKDYMQTTEWVQMWRGAMKLTYDPVCDIRAVKNRPGKRKEVAEVAKYTLKDTDFLHSKNPSLTDKLVTVLGDSLKHKRLFAFGGVLKEIAKELKVDEKKSIAEDDVREDVASVMVNFRWNFGAMNYFRID